jgi:ABC-type arginine transport system permease subunit
MSIWDTAMVALWIVVWFTVLGMILGIIGAATKKRKQRNEVYEKLRKAVKTQKEFDDIVQMMQKKDDK